MTLLGIFLIFASIAEPWADAIPVRTNPSPGFSSSDCPLGLLNQIKRDSKSSFINWIQAPSSCEDQTINYWSKKDPLDFEIFISKTLFPEGLDHAPISLTPSCLSGTSSQKRSAIAEYYLKLSWIKNHLQADIENLSSIDQVLKSKPLSDLSCTDLCYKEVVQHCSELKTCPQNSKLSSKLRADTLNAINKIHVIEREGAQSVQEALADHKAEFNRLEQAIRSQTVNPAESDRDRPSKYLPQNNMGAHLRARREEVRAKAYAPFRERIEAIKSLYPWIEGTAFLKETQGLKDYRNSITQALEAQFGENRKRVLRNIQKHTQMNRCLYQWTDNCDPLWKGIDDFPPLFETPKSFSPSKMKAGVSGQAYLNEVSCRIQMRQNRDDANRAAKEFFTESVITVATMGVGSIVSTARAAVAAGRAGRLATFGASAGRRALILGDIAYGTKGVRDAIEACDQLLNQVVPHHSSPTKTKHSCDSDDFSEIPVAVSDYKGCVVSALASFGGDILPLLPSTRELLSGLNPNQKSRLLKIREQMTSRDGDGLLQFIKRANACVLKVRGR